MTKFFLGTVPIKTHSRTDRCPTGLLCKDAHRPLTKPYSDRELSRLSHFVYREGSHPHPHASRLDNFRTYLVFLTEREVHSLLRRTDFRNSKPVVEKEREPELDFVVENEVSTTEFERTETRT